MENDYGVGVSNRYDVFLEEEEDPLEMLRSAEQQKEAKKKIKVQEKENRNTVVKVEPPKGKTTVPVAAKKHIKETQNLKSLDVQKGKEENKAPRAPRQANSVKFAPESREERNNRRNREDRVSAPNEARENSRNFEGRGDGSGDAEGRGRGRGGMGRGRGRGSWRGGSAGGNQGEYRPKREFDRHSGSDKSGVKAVDKRDGGGAHNWGTYRDEINEQLDSNYLGQEPQEWSPDKANSEQSPAAPPATDAPTDVKETEASEGEGQGTTEESPAKELTLDEWKALRGNRQKPTFNIRKAGEGEDPSQWKKMYALNKKKEGEEEDDEEEEYEIAEYPQRVGRQKHLLEIDIHFSDSRRGGRMRGGPRGGPGRGMNARGGQGVNAGGDAPRSERPGPVTNNERPTDVTPRAEHPPEAEKEVKDHGEQFEAFDRGGPRGRGGRGRGGRGARGGPNFFANNVTANQGAGSRGRGGYNRQHQSAPKVDDEKDFPSLG